MTTKERTRRAMEVAAKLPPLTRGASRRRKAEAADRPAGVSTARTKVTHPPRLRSL